MDIIWLLLIVGWPLWYIGLFLYESRGYVEPGHISPKLEPGSDEWMRALLEPGDQQAIANLEHDIDNIPDFDQSIVGKLTDDIYHYKDCTVCHPPKRNPPLIENDNATECGWCSKPRSQHSFEGKCVDKKAPRIPSVRERQAADKRIRNAMKRSKMVLPAATYSSEPSTPVIPKDASLTTDDVSVFDGDKWRRISMQPGETATRHDERMELFLKWTEPSNHLLTVNKMPEGVPSNASASLRHFKKDPKVLFIMYKWWDESWGGQSLYHVRHVVLDDNKSNRRSIGASTGPR